MSYKPCQIEAILENCKFFEENSALGRIPVGNYSIPNPRYRPVSQNQMSQPWPTPIGDSVYGGYAGSASDFEEINELQLGIQAQILYDSDFIGTSAFKISLSNQMNLSILSTWYNEESNQSLAVAMIHWPPTDPKATPPPITKIQFENEVLQKLTKNSRESLLKKLKTLNSKFNSQLHTNQNSPPSPGGEEWVKQMEKKIWPQ